MPLPACLLYPAITLATASAASAYLWYQQPGLVVRVLMRLALYKTGVRINYVQGKKYRYCYAEKGKRNSSNLTMFLIHGFGSSKDMWIPLLQRLPKDIHVIVMDLPGHGNTTVPTKSQGIDIMDLVDCTHEFTELVGLTREEFHLVGTSLGGLISALYAASNPQHVGRMTLICPAVHTPVQTEFMEKVRSGQCALLPETPEDMVTMMDAVLYNKKIIPKNKQFIKGLFQMRLPKSDFFKRLLNGITEDMDGEKNRILEEAFPNMTCPTQVIWGDKDELIHMSGADMLKQKLPNCQRVDIVPECGHSASMDRPGQVTKVLLEFHAGPAARTKSD